MTTINLMYKILNCKSKGGIIKLLNKYRVSIEKSKYC